ncbi:MAG TPA: ATP-dependent Clp protease proteolytic subunit, partial [Gemmatimonadaceae bacterium]
MSQLTIPYVIERSPRGERSYDLFSRLLMDRILFLGSEINDDVANLIIAQLLFLEADAPGREIQLYVNSPGGSVQSGLAIYDTMQHITAPVATTCVGMAASMGAFLLAAGAPGKRAALPHARIMMHQPWSTGTKGSAADIEIAAREIVYLRGRMFEILGKLTHQPLERIEREFDRDRYMSSEEAQRFGMIDRV